MYQVGFGGLIGSLLRSASVMVLDVFLPGTELWSIYLINILGSALIGLMAAGIRARRVNDAQMRFMVAGMLGSFTTFSLYSASNLSLLQDGRLLAFMIFSLTQIGAGLVAVRIAFRLGSRSMTGPVS